MNLTQRDALRVAVRHFYDLQVIRQQHAGRISRKNKNAQAVISDEIRQKWAAQTKTLEGIEKEALGEVEEILAGISFYRDVLDTDDARWQGLGPTMAGVILSEVNIEVATTVSKLWKYAGLAPVAAWRCSSCNRLVHRAQVGGFEHAPKKKNEKKCEHEDEVLREHQLYDSGERERPKKGEKRHYNLFLKTKLLGVLAKSFMFVNKGDGNPIWRPVYDNYKHRLISAGRGTSPGHIANSATRYMIKMFLIDFWKEWRAHEGLEVRPPYHEEKLGHVHGQ